MLGWNSPTFALKVVRWCIDSDAASSTWCYNFKFIKKITLCFNFLYHSLLYFFQSDNYIIPRYVLHTSITFYIPPRFIRQLFLSKITKKNLLEFLIVLLLHSMGFLSNFIVFMIFKEIHHKTTIFTKLFVKLISRKWSLLTTVLP